MDLSIITDLESERDKLKARNAKIEAEIAKWRAFHTRSLSSHKSEHCVDYCARIEAELNQLKKLHLFISQLNTLLNKNGN